MVFRNYGLAIAEVCPELRVPMPQVPYYIAAQLVGGTFGSYTILLLYGSGSDGAVVLLKPSGNMTEALLAETIATFFLMFMAAAVATDSRAVNFSQLEGFYVIQTT